jgi:O-acetyl-ADP-ribose deacetylase (regulator of RNase III)
MSVRIEVASGNLAEGNETVLVNASNTNVVLGSGVSAAIAEACGEDRYQDDILHAMYKRFGGPMEPGQVLITDAGIHPRAKWVAHVAVMDYRRRGVHPIPDASRIERGCKELWSALSTLPERVSVAMPALGAGVGALGVRGPTEIACRTLKEHLESGKSQIAKVVFYGYLLHELLVIVEVVGQHFTLGPDQIPEVARTPQAGPTSAS